jgi:hypothetical protein
MAASRPAWIASLVLLAIAVAVAFAPAVQNGFVTLDDGEYILDNAALRAPLPELIRWSATTFHAGNWHPLTWVSHALDVRLFGLDPRGHHLVNVLLHAANTLLLCLALAQMTGSRGRSLAVALLFGLHPLRVESVAWASERKDLLAAFFCLLALLAHVAHRRRPGRGRYPAMLLLYAAALLSKPSAVAFPVMMLLLDSWPLGGGSRAGGVPGWRRWAWVVPLFLMAAGAGVLTLAAQRHGGAVSTLADVPPGARLAAAAVNLASYPAMLFVPFGLSAVRPFATPSGGTVALALAALAGVTAGTWWVRRRLPSPAVGWGWCLAATLPVSGLLQAGLQSVADRYTYLAHAGLLAGLAWAIPAPPGRRAGRYAAAAVAGAAILLGGLTFGQTTVWRDSLALYGHAVRVGPGNWLAHFLHGGALADAGRREEAAAEWARAAELNPGYAPAHHNLAIWLEDAGRTTAAEAAYRRAVAADPGYLPSQSNLGGLLVATGRAVEGYEWYRRVALADPASASARYNLGYALEALGRPGDALAEYLAAARLDPGHRGAAAAIRRLGTRQR